MGRYRYQEQDGAGQPIEGEIEAADVAEARLLLQQQAIEPRQLVPLAGALAAEPASPRLSDREAEEVLLQVAELGTSQLPLAEGLRAAADESPSWRIARALRCLARDVAQGKSLEFALRQRRGMLPAYLGGLVESATRSGRLGLALDELVEHQRLMRDVRRSIVAAVAYPLIVLLLTAVLLSLMPLLVVPEFKRIFEEFALELPAATRWLIQLSDTTQWLVRGPGLWIALIGVGLLAVLLLGIPGVLRAAQGRRILATFPLVGVLWLWSGASAFARLLAVLVDNGVPLPEALRLTGEGLRDASLQEVCRHLRAGVEEGHALSELMAETPRLPASLVPLVRWGEKTGELAEALRSGSDMLVGRIRLRAVLLRSISPPLIFVIVFLAVGLMVVSLFLPLFSLVQSLA